MNIFIPISSTHTDQTGALVAIGAAKLADAGSSAAAHEPVWQMSNSKFAGEATIELVNGVAQVHARISEELAATKTTARVYRGFSLAVLKGADGSTRIARIALVDSPDAVTKGAGAQFLKLSRNAPMAKQPSVLIKSDQVQLAVRQAKDRKAEAQRLSEGRIGKAAALNPDNVIGSIRQALAQPFKENAGMIAFLNGRRA